MRPYRVSPAAMWMRTLRTWWESGLFRPTWWRTRLVAASAGRPYIDLQYADGSSSSGWPPIQASSSNTRVFETQLAYARRPARTSRGTAFGQADGGISAPDHTQVVIRSDK